MARFDLGLSDSDFWDSTPDEFDALYGRLSGRQKWELGLMAALFTQQINLHRQKGTRTYKPVDVFPALRDERPEHTAADLRAQIIQANQLLGGTDNR